MMKRLTSRICKKLAPILDACCGGRMFWFDKHDKRAIFIDNRRGSYTLCDGRRFKVNPDRVMDFTKMDFPDKSFKLVVFDPPHLTKVGSRAYIAIKYGKLDKDLRTGEKLLVRDLVSAGGYLMIMGC